MCRVIVYGVGFSVPVSVTSNKVLVMVLDVTLSKYLFSSAKLSGDSQTKLHVRHECQVDPNHWHLF